VCGLLPTKQDIGTKQLVNELKDSGAIEYAQFVFHLEPSAGTSYVIFGMPSDGVDGFQMAKTTVLASQWSTGL